MKKILIIFSVMLSGIALQAQTRIDTIMMPQPDGSTAFKAVGKGGQNGILAQGHYTADKKKDGTFRSFYDNGNIQSIEQYSNGVLNGNKLEFATNASLTLQETYVQGKKEGQSRRYEYGQLVLLENYKNGLLDGDKRAFYESGAVQEEGRFVNGQRQGVAKWYHQNGKPSIQFTYVNGLNNGPGFTYYESGNKQSEGQYKSDAETGDWKEYYDNDNNTIKAQGKFKEGNKTGDWQEYDENGKLLKTITYNDKGEVVKETPAAK